MTPTVTQNQGWRPIGTTRLRDRVTSVKAATATSKMASTDLTY